MSGYIGNIPVPQATQTRDVFTATAGQTSFATSGYTPGFLDVYLNGVHLVNGTDYTASNGSDVVLSSGATAGDNVEVVSYATFEVFGQTFTGNSTFTGDVLVADKIVHDGDTNTAIRFPAADTVTVETAGSERMRIDASGNLLVGTTVTPSSSSSGCSIEDGAMRTSFGAYTGAGTHIYFINGNGTVGTISSNGTSTSYNTTSDYRLKENVTPLSGAADRLAQIPVHRFNFIADPDRTVDGFLAHEVQAFVPECVTGTKDQVETVEIKDEEGNVIGTEERPVYQGIDQSKLTPLLTAALQEALARIETLEAEVAALKGEPA